MTASQHLSTAEAAHIIGVTRWRVQQLCREWIESDGAKGLRCELVGHGRHAVYIIAPADIKEFLLKVRKRGWPKGKPRGKKSSATSDTGGDARGPGHVSAS